MMKRIPLISLWSVAVVFVGLAVTMAAQPAAGVSVALARSENRYAAESLPDAPSAMRASSFAGTAQAGTIATPTTRHPGDVASKYTSLIPAGVAAQPLSAGDKVKLGLVNSVSPLSLIGISVSAGFSHLIDSAPHYGTDRGGFGERFGAAAARSTTQTLATDVLFAPIFHDDPRYYELGHGHSLVGRAVYAAERVVVTRSDRGQQRLNAPLLLGYAVAAGLTNAYYPDRDTGAANTAESYASSLGGAVLGFEVNEFLDDALHVAHLRHR